MASAPAQAGNDLSAEAARGEAIFETGKGSAGDQITAIVGQGRISLPGAALPCASCHGRDGRGRAEASVVPNDLTWAELTKPYGHTHDNGRRHPPFTDSTFLQAVRQGIDPAGNALDPAMPRFRLSDADAAALLAYVKRLGDLSDPGVGPEALRIGLLLPADGGLTEASGRSLERMLRACFDSLNEAGGIHRRSLRLIVRRLDLREGAAKTVERLRADDLFAVLAAIPPTRQLSLAEQFEHDGVPLLNLLPATAGAGGGESTRYLLPGPDEEARALVEFASRMPVEGNASLAVVHDGGSGGMAFAGIVERQAAKLGLGLVRRFAAPASVAEATALVAALRGYGVDRLVWVASGRTLPAFAEAAMAAFYQPAVLLPGTIAGSALFALDRRLQGKVFAAYTLLPSDWQGPGAADFLRLQQSAGLQSLPTLPQVIAYAAVRVVVEALQRSGRSLTREAYIRAVQAIQNLETGVTPPVSFGADRAIGLAGSHVAKVDLDGQGLLPLGRWIPGSAGQAAQSVPATASSQP